jgi:hypothetical protein
MIGTLERRLARLEAGAGIGADLPVIFVSFASPDGTDPPANGATVNGCAFSRERVEAEAKPIPPGGVVVGFLA